MDCWSRGVAAALAVMLMLVAGCGEPPQPEGSGTDLSAGSSPAGGDTAAPAGQQEPATGGDGAEATDGGSVSLEPLGADELDALLKDQNSDEVVFVDFWATWCVPCQASFHHTVELNRKYAKDGLKVVSISVDQPDEATRGRALEFLQKQQATFANFIAAEEDDADPAAWGIDAGLPHYRLYRNGELVTSFQREPDEAPPTAQELEAAIRQTLGLGN